MDPFEQAAMAEMGGAPMGPAPMGPEQGMLPGGPLDAGPGDGTVQCQVCRTVVDAASGEPLQPVDQSAAEAAQLFVAGGGQAAGAEFGGQMLDLEGPGGPPMF